MKDIEKYYHVSILIHFYIPTYNNLLLIITFLLLLLQVSAQPAPSPLAVPSTSHNHNDRGPLHPQVSRLEDPAVIHLYWDIHCIPKGCMTQKIGVQGLDFKITSNNAHTRRYQELVNEFNSVMEDVVNEVL